MENWYGYYMYKIVMNESEFYRDFNDAFNLKLNGKDSISGLKDGVYSLDDSIFLKIKDKLILNESDCLLGKYYYEMCEFNDDIDKPLIFNKDIYKTKPFFGNYFEISPEIIEDDYESYRVTLDGKYKIDIVSGSDEGFYSAYDGVDGYGWYPSVKLALKSYLEIRHVPYDYDGSDECSNCRGGGCLYCEPHRFL